MNSAATLIAELGEGLRRTHQGYERLQQLLERQFQAALRHAAAEIGEISEEIASQVQLIEAQGRRDREVLAALLGSEHGRPSVRELLRRLPRQKAAPLLQRWRALQRQLADCKALNLRNNQLMTEQQALMQQLLGREEHIYAER
ncbi:MAG: hypothetical protein DI603_02430 [Roseateles depolymerans]|uniref:Flagellar protein FlgN n=1 Tax=Roseateles depolymerans TaxID=76731 RepID=A0A2W5DYA7_9BURK|nr:MAG: hypothetical protein DI603_02430 [Roseateles depolymerans]